MDALPGPAVRRRQLGRQLRDLRLAAGFPTIAAAAARSGLSTATISRIENAKLTILPKNVRALCQAYGIGAPLLDHLLRLAEESEDRGWFVANSDVVPDWFGRYAAEEAEAVEIRAYEAEYVPGLLQTDAVTAELVRASRPNVTEEDVRTAVEVRRRRQTRLDCDEPPHLVAIINEAVIRRVVSSSEVMREQVQHLLEMSHRRNVELRILPFSAGAHPGMTGSFSMLRFPEDDGLATIFVEVQAGALYPDRPADFERYTWVFQRLTELALSRSESRELLTRVMEQM